MILRSVMQHVRDQNWTAVGIDFVIVGFGVFVGIQVSNRNEDRGSRQRVSSSPSACVPICATNANCTSS